ncbi:efflux RND transporter periplasmic adaptor subunit [Spartinivicinus poritis]|uniref:Efflux RND transporter periplasmic adaptor subunit n=1 Tax=Spartinivicinus poritis TaxID=2994640 RepID=A0ABT5UB63_9GAMM|nr:efflux RND transporter periplasmic adaptor subunit [Spartinivicinus sp. A2-2]MDE1463625.1 efflux RND transporter periplasmic adaptor subunit [Spartinivicinus sp. A2-2]
MKSKRWIFSLLICLISLSVIFLYKYTKNNQEEVEPSSSEPSATIDAGVVHLKKTTSTFETVGEIVAPQLVVLQNEMPGKIVLVNFKSGATVEKGKILLQQDISEENAKLKALNSKRKLLKLNMLRIKKLLVKKAVSQDSYDQAKSQYEIASADIQALQAIIDKKTLRAPFDAYVGIHNIEVGEYLEANSKITSLVGVNDYVWVDFRLPQDKSDVKTGDLIFINANKLTGKVLQGEIIAKDVEISAKSRNLWIRAKLLKTTDIRPNTTVNVEVPIGAMKTMPYVPLNAVKIDALGSYVYVLERTEQKDYKAFRRQVSLGKETNNFIYIESGLKAGELIATNGSFKLRDGLLVNIKQKINLIAGQ